MLAPIIALTPAVFAQQVDAQLATTYQRLRPAGETREFPGRPVDMTLTHDGGILWVKDRSHVRVFDARKFEELAEAPLPGGASLTGIASGDGRTVWATNAASEMHHFAWDGEKITLAKTIRLPGKEGASFPCGLAVQGAKAFVALSRNNTLAEVDLQEGRLVREVQVGIAPYDVAVRGSSAWVSLQGGRMAEDGERTAPSSGTPTPIRPNGAASSGGVAKVDLGSFRSDGYLAAGLQPSDILIFSGAEAVVANANSDSLTFFDPGTMAARQEVVVKPDDRLPFGSMPTALAASEDGSTLFAALAGNNAIAVIDAASRSVRGFIPTGWYPASVIESEGMLLIGNMKGIGSRSPRRDAAQGWNSHDHRGSVQRTAVPGQVRLRAYSQQVREDARIPQALAAIERRTRSSAKPSPIPAKLGDPSTIEHVVYIIKENRTYDQYFGALPQGDGEPSLCVFPEPVTPNHHAIATRWGLLDNYYCNGVLSADGHSWATEGNVTPYLERAFGGFTRSYTFGDDPITYSSSGFIWDHILLAGLSFRNFGEMDYAEPPQGWSVDKLWRNYQEAGSIEFTQKIGIRRLQAYSSRRFPGWNMGIPDVLRAQRFIEELGEMEKSGSMPNLTIVYLPQDHGAGATPGYPTMASYMADNDLAVGMVVEALSKSRFWPKTAVFINEDDPQGGFDHVDGHRSICLVASPYAARKKVVSQFYNQSSVLHTICRIFGIPPMNQQVALAPLMAEAFTSTPDFTPYEARDPQTDRMALNPPLEALSGEDRWWAEQAMTIPLQRPGLKSERHDDLLNRMVWRAMKPGVPYPAEWAGYHGRGLKEKGLVFGGGEED
jgi:YVTN family beta-propeller protein